MGQAAGSAGAGIGSALLGAGLFNSPTKTGDVKDVKFADPTGNYAAQQANLANYLQQYGGDLSKYGDINTFLNQANQLSGLVSGQNSALQQQLNAVAAREAALGGEAALGAMPGGKNTGAGMAAFGSAYADPFAKAQAQLQQNQVNLTGNLWGQQMGQNTQMASTYADLLKSALQQQTDMASNQGDLWSPEYGEKLDAGKLLLGKDWWNNPGNPASILTGGGFKDWFKF